MAVGLRGKGVHRHTHPQSTLPLFCKPSKKCFALQVPTEPAGIEVILAQKEDTEQKSPAPGS